MTGLMFTLKCLIREAAKKFFFQWQHAIRGRGLKAVPLMGKKYFFSDGEVPTAIKLKGVKALMSLPLKKITFFLASLIHQRRKQGRVIEEMGQLPIAPPPHSREWHQRSNWHVPLVPYHGKNILFSSCICRKRTLTSSKSCCYSKRYPSSTGNLNNLILNNIKSKLSSRVRLSWSLCSSLKNNIYTALRE